MTTIYNRTAIIGVPGSGKSTRARKNYTNVVHTDDFLGIPTDNWSERSERIAKCMLEKQFCIEGCDVVRGLRKFLKLHPGVAPADHVIWLGVPKREVTDSQRAFGKGCKKIFEEILPELHARNVVVTIENEHECIDSDQS